MCFPEKCYIKKKRLHVRGMNKHTLKGKKENLSGVNLLDTSMNAQFLCSSLCLDNPTMLHMRHNDGKHYNEDEKSSPFINDFFFLRLFFCVLPSLL